MDVNKGPWLLLLILHSLYMTNCKVIVGVTIISYTNLNGTAYVDTGSSRKCCDGAQRADCATGDTCDTSIYICLSASVGPGWSCSSGASFQTKTYNNTNTIQNVPEMTAVADDWQPGMTIFATINDDDSNGFLKATDHIDTLTQDANFLPSTSKLQANTYDFTWSGKTTLHVKVRAWCAPDYYGSRCQVHCSSLSPVAVCDPSGNLVCQQEGILLLEFIQPTTKDQFPALDLGLNQFWAEQVCHSNKSSIFYPQLNNQTNTMTFNGYCGQQELRPLQMENLLMTSQEAVLRHYFSPGVKLWSNSSIQGYGEHITPNVKVSIELLDVSHPFGTSHDGYDTNSTMRCCDVPSAKNCVEQTDTCDLQITICIGKLEQRRCIGTVMETAVFPDTLTMKGCGPTLIDSTKGIVYPAHPMIGAFHLEKFGQVVSLQAVVEDSDNGTGATDVIDVLGSAVSVKPGSSIFTANKTDISMAHTVRLVLRMAFWCAPGHSGPDCSPDNGTDHCQKGWQGEDCDVQIESCTPNPCANGGTCQLNSTAHFNCTCTPGYQGDTCETDVNECDLNICKNGATCQNLPGAFNCVCTDGWGGLICTEKIPQCIPSPCLHGGKCLARPGTSEQYICQCAQGWIGRNCEQRHVCSRETCIHGNCTQQGSDVFCVCDRGFKGDNCTEDIDECEAHPCENGGSCANTFGGFNCSCLQGFYGQRCESKTSSCQSVTCQNNGTCIEARLNLLGFKCLCHQGYTGLTCESPIDPCQNVVCENGGVCQQYGTDFRCNCSIYWTGKTCDADINECSSGVCKHSISCANSAGSYKCVCQNGWSGTNCDLQTASCQGKNCSGHGTCYDSNNAYACNCDHGFTGHDCERDINECSLGVCIPSHTFSCLNLPGSYACACNTGWTGVNCTVKKQKDCSTVNMPCSGNGMCRNSPGGFTCQCFPGFNGSRCEHFVNTCNNMKCMNNGTCKVTPDGPKCVCPQGWSGITCSQDVNECEVNRPCKHNGVCVNNDGGFYCDCAGWTGSVCQTDVNECVTSVCKNNGVCANEPGGYTCGCQTGWLGMSCEIKQLDNLSGYIVEFDFGANITSDRKQPIISYVYTFLSSNVCNGSTTSILIRSVINNVINFTASCGGTSVTKATIDAALASVSRDSIFLVPLSTVRQVGEVSPNTGSQKSPSKRSWPTILGVILAVVFVAGIVGAIFVVRRRRQTKQGKEGFNNPTFSSDS